MEHIRTSNWCSTHQESQHFVTEEVMDNSVIERILSNKFYDPLISSDEENTAEIDWDQVFSKVNTSEPLHLRTYIPGLRPVPMYPHISSLSQYQQMQLLKVVNSMYPNVLDSVHIPRPTKLDRTLYDDLKEKYLKEQKEYISWAKGLWTSGQNIRALRPKPIIETVYEAEFKVKMAEHQALPKQYEMAAQISFQSDAGSCEFVPQKDLIKVSNSEIPQHTSMSELFDKKVSIIKLTSLPEPCRKHPCRFVLPGDTTVSLLPLTEVQRELAQYAIDNGAKFCASESALRKLVEGNAWNLSVAVCKVTGPDGHPCNVVVIGSDLTILKENSRIRTYKAFRHLLLSTLIPPQEKARIVNSWKKKPNLDENKTDLEAKPAEAPMDLSDDEESQLFIDIDNQQDEQGLATQSECSSITETNEKETNDRLSGDSERERNTVGKDTLPQLFSCTCEDTVYERPPVRSFRRWEAKSKNSPEKFNILVHCSHKLKGKSGEVVIEPIPEYQIDLGASEIAEGKLRSLALALHLRKNASALLMRIDGVSGDLVTWDNISLDEMNKQHQNFIPDAAHTVYSVLNNLKDLLPGNYIMKHEPEHGENALLFAARTNGTALSLNFDLTAPTDDAKCLDVAPTLIPVLLPFHKHRNILPCAFTPYPNQLPKESRKPAARQKAPPQALKWPKKKKKGNTGHVYS